MEKFASRLCCLIPKFNHLRPVLTEALMQIADRIVYFALIESLLQYAIVTWEKALNQNFKCVENVQRRLIHMILGRPLFYPNEQLDGMSRVDYSTYDNHISRHWWRTSGRTCTYTQDHKSPVPYSTKIWTRTERGCGYKETAINIST